MSGSAHRHLLQSFLNLWKPPPERCPHVSRPSPQPAENSLRIDVPNRAFHDQHTPLVRDNVDVGSMLELLDAALWNDAKTEDDEQNGESRTPGRQPEAKGRSATKAQVEQASAGSSQGAISSASEVLVIVRCFGGVAHVMSLLRVDDGRAYVCRPDELDEIRSGKRPPPFAGFSLEDVFEFSESEMNRIRSGHRPRWDRLRCLRPRRAAWGL